MLGSPGMSYFHSLCNYWAPFSHRQNSFFRTGEPVNSSNIIWPSIKSNLDCFIPYRNQSAHFNQGISLITASDTFSFKYHPLFLAGPQPTIRTLSWTCSSFQLCSNHYPPGVLRSLVAFIGFCVRYPSFLQALPFMSTSDVFLVHSFDTVWHGLPEFCPLKPDGFLWLSPQSSNDESQVLIIP